MQVWEGNEQSVSQKTCQVTLFIGRLSGERLKMQVAFACICNTSFRFPAFHNLLLLKTLAVYMFTCMSFCLSSYSLYAQQTDTLSPVKVLANKLADISATTQPLQQLDKTALQKLNSISVADAVKYFSGVVVKDYGGIGGLKTISVRSLGANHTGVLYDGWVMGDAQGGQIDLGRLSLDNVSAIQLFSNQPADILLPARSFASAAILSLSTTGVQQKQEKEYRVTIKQGSFGFINPSLLLKNSIHQKFAYALNIEYQQARGDYSFIDYETGNGKNKRINSDIASFRAEYDMAYRVNDSNSIKWKNYYYDSKRGLPGAVVLFNNNAGERLNNRLFFSQASWQKSLSIKSKIKVGAKYSADFKYYLDPNFPNIAGKLENEFYQKEWYLSAVHSYQWLPGLTSSYAIDYFRNQLKRTDAFAQNFANPTRHSILNNLAFQYRYKSFDLTGNVLHTITREKVEKGTAAKDQQAFAPALAVAILPVKTIPLRFRLSYKRIFRLPSFDDLYYTNVGNANLKPEYAHQYNAGLTYKMQSSGCMATLLLSADAYHNRITDKILAIPRENLFQWTMLNIGKVQITGADIGAHMYWKEWKQVQLSTHVAYGYQDAQDRSDPGSVLYKNQLPYTPRHSGSVIINMQYKALGVNLNALFSSYRYRLGEQIPANLVKEWANQDMSISYQITTKKQIAIKLLAELNNIFNSQYEIIRYYPMPRRNYRIGCTFSMNKS